MAVETVTAIELPERFGDLVALIRTKRQFVLQAAAQHSKTRPLTTTMVENLHAFFRVLNNVEMTPLLKKETKLDVAMQVVQDKNRFNFPDPFPAMAKALEDLWVSQNWGADEVKEESSEDEDDEDGAPGPSSISAAPTARASRAAPAPAAPETRRVVRVPHPNHPIYGVNGIMHGILVVKGKTTSYMINDGIQRRNASAFGHNGLQVGDCWPLQIAALRDGAHGRRIGGISGKVTEGAYSVVVSGMYDELDQDYGDIVHYSGSNSHDNKDRHEPKISEATKCLQRSITTQRPVRVIRSSGSGSRFAPAAGLRYDGLYRVARSSIERNGHGGAYIQFRLERLGNQPPIALNRPTHQEQRDFGFVRQGY